MARQPFQAPSSAGTLSWIVSLIKFYLILSVFWWVATALLICRITLPRSQTLFSNWSRESDTAKRSTRGSCQGSWTATLNSVRKCFNWLMIKLRGFFWQNILRHWNLKVKIGFLFTRLERGGPDRAWPELVRVQGVVREPVLRRHRTFLHSRVNRISSAESSDRIHEESWEASQRRGAQSPGNFTRKCCWYFFLSFLSMNWNWKIKSNFFFNSNIDSFRQRIITSFIDVVLLNFTKLCLISVKSYGTCKLLKCLIFSDLLARNYVGSFA